MPSDVLQGSRLRCVIGDNAADASSGHHAGLNGIWSLQVLQDHGWSESVFAGGGFNLEHYFDRRNWRKFEADWVDKLIYEPRHHPMALRRSGDALVLRQAATPFWGVESESTFRIVEPDTIAFRCDLTPRRRGFQGPDLGAFWANYMRQPEDPGLWYWSRSGAARRHWHPDMADRSTVCGVGEAIPDNVPDSLWLFQNFDQDQFTRPVMWGGWRQYLWGLMLRSEHRVRLALGPTGGGAGNPAWDFQLVVPDYEVGHTYWIEGALVVAELTPEQLLERCTAWSGPEA